jgi:hypothetical protein
MSAHTRQVACGLALALSALLPAPGSAATLRSGFTETTVASGLASPTAMAFAPDGRLFVCQQGGQLRVIKDGALLPAPFLTVTVNAAGERGLLGVAVDPNFEINQYVYVYYTATAPNLHNRVSRFTASGDLAVPGSEQVLLALSATGAAGQAVTFGVLASGAQPLSYQWQRDGLDIAGATSSTYTLTASAADTGAQFRCRVFNASGEALSDPATLTLAIGRLPLPRILAPSVNARYVAGGVVAYSGFATDAEDGVLPPARFTWEVVFHHDAHTHPFRAPRTGDRRGSFVIPDEGETSTSVWYRIRLTVTDSDGQQSTTFRDVRPRIVQLTLVSNPLGLVLTLDGEPVATPYAFQSVVGMRRSIGVVSVQTLNGSTYEFRRWSVPRTPTHSIATPVRPTRFIAIFRRVRGAGPTIRRWPLPCVDTPAPDCADPAPGEDAPEPPPGSRFAIPRQGRS